MFIQNRFLPITFFLLTIALLFLAACQPSSTTAVADVVEVTPRSETAVATPTPRLTNTLTPTLPQPTETAVAPPPFEPTPDNATVNLTLTDDFEASLVLQVGGSPQAVTVVDNIAYLGIGARLVLVDVSNPAAPQLIAESGLINDVVRDIAVVDNMVYAAAGRSGLAVFDVSEPTSVEIVNPGPSYAGANPANADTVLVADGFAFVRDMNRDDGGVALLAFDLSQPTQPALLETIPLADYSKIDIYDDIVTVSNSDKIDFRHTADPTVTVSSIPLAQHTYATHLIFADDLVVVSTAGSRLIRIYDITDLANPQKVSDDISIDLLLGGYATSANGRMFVGGTFGEFGYCSSEIWIFDIQQLESVQQVTNFDPFNCLSDLTAVGDILYTTGLSGLQLFDVSNPTQPQHLSTFIHPSGVQDVLAVVPNGQYVYILGNEGRGSTIQTVDINKPDSPLVGEPLPIMGSPLFNLYISNDMLFAPVSMGGINILDISDPAVPTLTYNATEEPDFYSYQFALALADTVLYEPTFVAGTIAAIDLTDPANPTVANKFQLGGTRLGNLVTDGSYLYALTYQYGEEETPGQVDIFSLVNPLFPQHISMFEWFQESMRLTLVDQTLVIGCVDGGCQSLYLVDVSDGANPVLGEEVMLPFEIQQLLPGADGRLYVMTPKDEIWRLDIDNPQQITAVGAFQLPPGYQSIKIVGELLYVAGNDAGLYIFKLPK